MTYLIISQDTLTQVAAPNLPLAPVAYDRQYHDQLNNVLRLYFNRIDALLTKFETSTVIPALTSYTVSTLPSAVTSGAGAQSFVTDATAPTFGSAVVGGGAVATPVYSDGTNWMVG